MRKAVILLIGILLLTAGVFVYFYSSGAHDGGLVENITQNEGAGGAGRDLARSTESAGSRSDGAAPRETARADGLNENNSVRVHGKVVMRDGSVPAEKLHLSLLTDDSQLNQAAFVELLGGRKQMERLRKSGQLDVRARELGGWSNGFTTISGEGGSFELRAPREMRKFTFDVQGDYVTYSLAEWFSNEPAVLNNEIVLIAEPAALVELTIKNSADQPMPGAWARFAPAASKWVGSQMTHERSLTSDSAGVVRLRGISKAGGSISAIADGCGPAEMKILGQPPGKLSKLTLKLPAELTASGIVVNDKGAPLGGIPLTLNTIGKYWGGLDYGHTRTEANGQFTFRRLDTGEHIIGFTADGMILYEGEPTVSLKAATPVKDLRFVLGEGGFMKGKVVDEAGAPIAGANINITTDYINSKKIVTDKTIYNTAEETRTATDGSFAVNGLANGVFRVAAAIAGRGSVAIDGVARNSENIKITIPEGIVVNGIITNAATGEPVPGARVTLLNSGVRGYYTGGEEGNYGQVNSGGDGKFTLPGVQAGKYNITATAPGFIVQRESNIELAAGVNRREISLAMAPGGTARGRVLDRATSAPIAGAIITISASSRGFENEKLRSDYMNVGMQLHRAVTGLDGQFELTGIPPGKTRFTATEETHIDSAAEPTEMIAGVTVDGIVIYMDAGGAIEGFAILEDGEPLAGGMATATLEDEEVSQMIRYQRNRETEIEPDGHFKISGLTPARWQVRAVAPKKSNKPPLAGFAQVEAGKTTKVEFYIPTGGVTIKGRLTKGGAPVEVASLRLQYKEKPVSPDPLLNDRLSASLAADGMFTLEHVPGGEAALNVRIYDKSTEVSGQNRWVEQLQLPSSGIVNINIDIPVGGGIHGRVVSRMDGRPVSGLSVMAEPAMAVNESRVIDSANQRTNDNGEYQFPGLLPGTYVISVRPTPKSPGQSRLLKKQSDLIQVVNNSDATVDFVLDTGGSILVEVLDETGAPAAGARVGAEPVGGDSAQQPEIMSLKVGDTELDRKKMERLLVEYKLNMNSRGSYLTDGNGIAQILGLEPGKYSIRATGRSGVAQVSDPVEISLNQELKVNLQFPKGHVITISCVDASDHAVAPEFISISDTAGRRMYDAKGLTPENPPRLTKGKYTIDVRAAGLAGRATFTIGDSAPPPIEVRLTAR